MAGVAMWLDSSVEEFLLWVIPKCKRSWVQIPVQPLGNELEIFWPPFLPISLGHHLLFC